MALRRWLLQRASTCGAFTAVDTALKIAYFVAGTRVAAPDLAALPSAEEVAVPCLAAIPVGSDHVDLLDDDRRGLHRPTRTEMPHPRQARNLLSPAEQHLDRVRDRELAERLRQWLAVKPRLV